jgi:hypothetical protein
MHTYCGLFNRTLAFQPNIESAKFKTKLPKRRKLFFDCKKPFVETFYAVLKSLVSWAEILKLLKFAVLCDIL